jgi:hypothetical protein
MHQFGDTIGGLKPRIGKGHSIIEMYCGRIDTYTLKFGRHFVGTLVLKTQGVN